MIFTKAQLIWGSTAADTIRFELENVSPTQPYVVKSISGLEPPPIALSIGEKVYEGGVLQGRRPDNREIIMLISFQPNYSIGENAGTLRKKLYAMLSPKLGSMVKFRLLNAGETYYVETTGQIKRIEANPFSKDPETQITMTCLSAFFSEAEFVHATPASLNGLATLPVTNPGDAQMGISLNLTLTAATPPTSFTLTGNSASDFLKITYAFATNDILQINTNPGARSVTRVRASVANVNLLPNVSADSNWLMMDPGLNNLKPSTTAYTVQRLAYTPKHWGF